MDNMDRYELYLERLISRALSLCYKHRGATGVVQDIIHHGRDIFDDEMRGCSALRTIVRLELHSFQIWELYAKLCQGRLSRFIALLRAVDTGLLTEQQLYKYLYGTLNYELPATRVRSPLPTIEEVYRWVREAYRSPYDGTSRFDQNNFDKAERCA